MPDTCTTADEVATVYDAKSHGAPLFTIRDLAKVYRMGEVEVHALKQVNLLLDEGQFVVLLGPSGSGKSTLLNIIVVWTHPPAAKCCIATPSDER